MEQPQVVWNQRNSTGRQERLQLILAMLPMAFGQGFWLNSTEAFGLYSKRSRAQG